jgi:YfiH family protein
MTLHAPPTTPPSADLETGPGLALPLPVLRSPLLGTVPGVTHGITRRVPGLGRADGNLGYSAPRDRADAWRMRQLWAAAVGVPAEGLTVAGQIHGRDVLRVAAHQAGRGGTPDSERVGLADALITDVPGVALLSLHADCLPLLLVDPERPAIGVVHAGWRGTVADVAGAAVRAMVDAFGSDPRRLLAHLGPAIGPCCYEVGAEVVAAWSVQDEDSSPISRSASPDAAVTFDLRRANARLLRRAGLRDHLIETSPICTKCAGPASFSHRGQGPLTGRFGAIIALDRSGTSAAPGRLAAP